MIFKDKTAIEQKTSIITMHVPHFNALHCILINIIIIIIINVKDIYIAHDR